MNERIRELAEQAKKYALDEMIKITDRDEALKIYSDCYDTKFAELIVRECMSMCQTAVGNADYNTGRLHCLNNIKEHFGVE